MSFRGAALCCVCKKFCKRSKSVCSGCGQHCHDKCRQSVCCHPCNKCWHKVLEKRSCVCGKSLRSLCIFVERTTPLTPSATSANVSTPSLPSKRNADRSSRPSIPSARQHLDFNKENTMMIEMEVHSHEESTDYLLRVRERGNNGSLEQWEDCRILTKFKVEASSGRQEVFCTIECRLRKDLHETKSCRPEQSMRYKSLVKCDKSCR